MANDSPISFDDLVDWRQRLYKFCFSHFDAITAFKDGISFKLHHDEVRLGPKARHLSSSVTCIESLLDCPRRFRPRLSNDISKLADRFALSAIERPHADWKSDESAHIYCRCRALPLVVYHLPKYRSRIEQHLERILWQLTQGVPRLAIGEASSAAPDPDNWYPPNAFHTYWTLFLVHAIKHRFENEFNKLKEKLKTTSFDIERLNEEMLLWAERTAGYQIALHEADSVKLDSDQLTWSLTILMKFGRDFQADLAQQDFMRHALKCIFQHQTHAGIWRTGAPLFHYKKSGNAYCHVFETFATLLKNVLTDRKEGLFLRQALRPYMRQLLRLWEYAIATKIPLPQDNKIFGWSSGHRADSTHPESWVTASVYSFSQCLRRLMGIWAREEAAISLKVHTSHGYDEGAVRALLERGDTWAKKGKGASTQLMTLFVNPARFFCSNNALEPDDQPVDDDQARGAILFGPPGTSKTTLSRSVADAIGWDYVELHASHFVADGLPNVQRTADAIFNKLMQLDRTVILFDEIDELVRARGKEPDAFGRFLTTSMLPKLAELWKARKVIYFVATNDIRLFDPAVTRAQRFDASVHVAPPSFKSKLKRITKVLEASSIHVKATTFTHQEVEKALGHAAKLEKKESTPTELPIKYVLGKFLLVRYDQLEELAFAIKKSLPRRTTVTLTRTVIEDALFRLADPFFKTCEPFRDFVESGKYEQRDYSKARIWEVKGSIPSRCRTNISELQNRNWFNSKPGFDDFSDLPSKCVQIRPGVIMFRK
jgi:hypothetical protein